MAKKRLLSKKFKTSDEMDEYLENSDLGEAFQKFGQVHGPAVRKINLDLPEWLITQLDIEATRAGVSRQPLIKIWLVEKLEEERKKRAA
jgi:hypothetical protein